MNLASLSAVEVGQLLDVSERTVRNWMNQNGLPSSDSGRGRTIEWTAALRWYVAYRIGETGSGGKSGKNQAAASAEAASETLDEAMLRKTRAEADLKELQLAKERGQVASIADVERVLAASNMATQTQVLAVPSRLATRMLGLEDHGRAVSILDAEMRQLLTNLATIDAVREATGTEDDAE